MGVQLIFTSSTTLTFNFLLKFCEMKQNPKSLLVSVEGENLLHSEINLQRFSKL